MENNVLPYLKWVISFRQCKWAFVWFFVRVHNRTEILEMYNIRMFGLVYLGAMIVMNYLFFCLIGAIDICYDNYSERQFTVPLWSSLCLPCPVCVDMTLQMPPYTRMYPRYSIHVSGTLSSLSFRRRQLRGRAHHYSFRKTRVCIQPGASTNVSSNNILFRRYSIRIRINRK